MNNYEILKLDIEELDAMNALRDQYKKELSDLEHNRGIAKTMINLEKIRAKNSLTNSIQGLNKTIDDLEKEIEKLKKEAV